MRASPSSENLVNDIRRSVGHFEPNPYLRLGETDSAHGVLFGDIPALGSVAVKPFTTRVRAMDESWNLRAVAKKGFAALEPLNVATGALSSYLITKRRPDLRPLSQLCWRADVASPRLRQTLEPALGLAAETAAAWHNAGIIHGDMGVKNLAYDTIGQSVFIDAERSLVGSRSLQRRTAGAHRDLALLTRSVLAKGLLADRSPRYRLGFVEDTFLTPYFDLVKPENFSLAPETRIAAIKDWATRYLASPIGRTPSFALPGFDPARAG